jgi:hypothetical protein
MPNLEHQCNSHEKPRTYIQVRIWILMRIDLALQDPDPSWGCNGAGSNSKQLQKQHNQDNPETLNLPRKFLNINSFCFCKTKC